MNHLTVIFFPLIQCLQWYKEGFNVNYLDRPSINTNRRVIWDKANILKVTTVISGHNIHLNICMELFLTGKNDVHNLYQWNIFFTWKYIMLNCKVIIPFLYWLNLCLNRMNGNCAINPSLFFNHWNLCQLDIFIAMHFLKIWSFCAMWQMLYLGVTFHNFCQIPQYMSYVNRL